MSIFFIFIINIGNILVIAKTFKQISVETLIYKSKFVGCKAVVDKVLGIRKMLRELGYHIEKLLRIFCGNKDVVLAIYCKNMIIKKRSMVFAFCGTREAIASGVIQL